MRFAPRRGACALALFLLFASLTPASPRSQQDDTDAQDPSVDALPGGGTLGRTKPNGSTVEVPLRHTAVRASITGAVASVDVEQVFSNPYRETIEAVYLFPLPRTAAVVDVKMRVGDHTLHGEIKT